MRSGCLTQELDGGRLVVFRWPSQRESGESGVGSGSRVPGGSSVRRGKGVMIGLESEVRGVLTLQPNLLRIRLQGAV
jgi:hypothetical protein